MNVYCDKLKLRHHQCGANCKLKLKSIFDIFQDAAAEHADILGCGMENMLENRTMWVLVRQKIEIIRLPGVGEQIKVETYPRGTDKLLAIREYLIYGEDGEIAIRGTANWLILDTVTLRPQRICEGVFAGIPDNSDLPVTFGKLNKLDMLSEAADSCFSVTVKSSDIDMNRHLNNANYAAMVQDALHKYEITVDRIKTVEINYLTPGQIGDCVNVRAEVNNTKAAVSGSYGSKAAFCAEVTLK